MHDDRQLRVSLDISGLFADLSKLDRNHSGPRHQLYRGRISDAPIMIKMSSAEQPKEGAIASLRHEYELLRELKSPGIVRVIGMAPSERGLALLMEDAGDTNLATLIRSRPLSIADFLNISNSGCGSRCAIACRADRSSRHPSRQHCLEFAE